MEPQGPLPRLQLSATCSYPEPARFSPCPTISHFLKIYLRLGLFPSGFPTKILYKPLLPPPPSQYYMPRPSHSSRSADPNNIWWAVQIIKPLVMKFSPLPCYLVLLGPNIFFGTLLWNTFRLHTSPNVSDQVSHPYKTLYSFKKSHLFPTLLVSCNTHLLFLHAAKHCSPPTGDTMRSLSGTNCTYGVNKFG